MSNITIKDLLTPFPFRSDKLNPQKLEFILWEKFTELSGNAKKNSFELLSKRLNVKFNRSGKQINNKYTQYTNQGEATSLCSFVHSPVSCVQSMLLNVLTNYLLRLWLYEQGFALEKYIEPIIKLSSLNISYNVT